MLSRTTHIEELPSKNDWWPEPIRSGQQTPGTMPDRDGQRQTLIVGPDGRTPILERVPVPFGFRPERSR